MKAFDAGVVPWIAFSRIRPFHSFCLVFVFFACVLHSSIAVDHQWLFDSSSSFCCFYTLQNFCGFHISSHHPPDYFSGIQIHHAGQIDKSFFCPDVGDIGTPYTVGIFGIELSFQKIVKFSIIPFRYGRFYLVFQIFRFDIGFFHDRIDILLASLDSMLMEDHGNLGRAIDLVRIVVDLDDCFFCFFPPDFCLGWFGSQMLVVAGSALLQYSQYTRYRYFGMFLFVFPNRSIEDTSRYLPSILIAFFNTFSASCVSLSSFLR